MSSAALLGHFHINNSYKCLEPQQSVSLTINKVQPGAGVLGCVSAGVPVEGVFPGDSGCAAALLFSSSSAIQGIDH